MLADRPAHGAPSSHRAGRRRVRRARRRRPGHRDRRADRVRPALPRPGRAPRRRRHRRHRPPVRARPGEHPGRADRAQPHRRRRGRTASTNVPGVERVVGDLAFPAALLDARRPRRPLERSGTAGHGWSSATCCPRPAHRRLGRRPAREIAVGAARPAKAARADVGDDVRSPPPASRTRSYRVSAVVDGAGGELFFSDATAGSCVRTVTEVDLLGLRVEADSVDSAADAVAKSCAAPTWSCRRAPSAATPWHPTSPPPAARCCSSPARSPASW